MLKQTAYDHIFYESVKDACSHVTTPTLVVRRAFKWRGMLSNNVLTLPGRTLANAWGTARRNSDTVEGGHQCLGLRPHLLTLFICSRKKETVHHKNEISLHPRVFFMTKHSMNNHLPTFIFCSWFCVSFNQWSPPWTLILNQHFPLPYVDSGVLTLIFITDVGCCNLSSHCWSIWCMREYCWVPVDTWSMHGNGARLATFRTAMCDVRRSF